MKTRKIYVAVPITVSEDGRHCCDECPWGDCDRRGGEKPNDENDRCYLDPNIDLVTRREDKKGNLYIRTPACRAAERRMAKMLDEAVKPKRRKP